MISPFQVYTFIYTFIFTFRNPETLEGRELWAAVDNFGDTVIFGNIIYQIDQLVPEPWRRRLWNIQRKTMNWRTCDLCGYSTAQAGNMRRHKMIHTGEKPYQCGTCDYSCITARSLEIHSYTHTGEKPYQCSSCDFSCTQAVTLKRHSYTHTGEKPYQCGSCDYSCTTASALKRHMVRHK